MEELTHPQDQNDGWVVSRPEDEDMDAILLGGLAPQFESWTDANVHAALIVHHGKLVYEHYFTGEDNAWATPLGRVSYHSKLRHDLRSITKSTTSLLFGMAVDRGWIKDLDESVFSYFPEHIDLRTPEKGRINLRHLLTMSAGLAWNEYLPYSDPANSERRMIDAPDQCRYVLEQPIARPPGVAYVYNGGLTALLATILQKTSGRPVDVLAAEMLFDPLGIQDVEWVRYADGTPNAVSGLRMRPRDLAKIGQAILGRGMWNGRRIVSEAWVDESTSPHVNGEGLFFYGFQWWLGRSLVRRREIRWISGVGYGGQRLFIVPELDLVVVVMAGLYDNPVLQSVPGEVILRRYALPAALAA
ncbi:beta-lactamase family protein [Mesorhizobium sp. YC-39]|uniref:serine hydrolase domain-containing protein n=1 Tax=unclassified Mesorhizobium TaxID=325217 RepID=UPI0021E91299|nr:MULTISPECIES: serine hydrolase [unclassified Mesorhizobium]MCV3210904.1 beta-lactamase family protein [Mesorhizobium sp. YC-2]MCV3231138.1 beta-lactamase family protein [Mesorhizobium sp. YC-39]